jgi:cytosine/uracil/thiamine/allantoin permease
MDDIVRLAAASARNAVLHGVWTRFTLVVIVGNAVMSLIASDALYDRFFVAVANMQALLVSVSGIAMADRVVMRANLVDLRGLYADGPGRAYHYRGRINPFAFVASLMGCAS